MKTPENTFQETTEPEETPKKQGLEVVIDEEAEGVKETLETLNSAISHDEPVTESYLDDLRSAIEGMKINIGGKEVTLKDAEILRSLIPF